MFPYSTILRPLFWIMMGLTYGITIAGAKIWAEDLGIVMTWWKWLLTIMWYCVLSLSFAGGFTLIGEKEAQAGYRFFVISLIGAIIMGAVLVYVLLVY